MTDQSRRRILRVGGTALVAGLAGCSGVTDQLSDSSNDDEDEDNPLSTEEPEQQYTVPPVSELNTDNLQSSENISMRAVFATTTTPGDLNVYFEDEITYELFVYTTYPVGNSVELTKVAEKTNAPYEQMAERFEVAYEDLPKNTQMRFRLKCTNNNTGDSEWAIDQRVFFYEVYGDDLITVNDGDSFSIIEGTGPLKRNRFQKKGSDYVMNFSGGRDFVSSEIIEEVPFSREAFKEENDLWNENVNEQPVCEPFHGKQITMPDSHVEMSEMFMDSYQMNGSYDTFTFTADVPAEYDFYGRGEYNVLGHPIYRQMSDAINKAQESYGVSNEFAKIQQAARHIQTNEYDGFGANSSIRTAPFHLPEAYLADPVENCVGHSYQLCWLLYHMGYTCGVAYLSRTSRGVADHIGVAMPVPESVMEEDFPEAYPEGFYTEGTSAYYIEQMSDIIDPAIQPDSMGEYPWVYIESTAVTGIGNIPFDDVDEAILEYAIEPENNVFGTDIGAPDTA